jgi:hypothetical protein
VREDERERHEHDRAREGEPEREPERAACGVDARGLTDALLLDRRQRVVGKIVEIDILADPASPSST